jgi:GNAT superfamily N-acetyltransferase
MRTTLGSGVPGRTGGTAGVQVMQRSRSSPGMAWTQRPLPSSPPAVSLVRPPPRSRKLTTVATPSRITLRRATVDDVQDAAQVLADAFGDYAWTRWTVAEHDHAQRLRELHATFLTAVALPYGAFDLVDVPDAGIGAVAVWMRSDAAVPDKIWEQVGAAAADLAGDRAAMADAAEAVLAPHRPTMPHVSLATIGVNPRLQGRGLGTALLVAGLRQVDHTKLPAHLETSEPRNVRLYQRHGFAISAAVDLPDGGPRSWSMLRRSTAP